MTITPAEYHIVLDQVFASAARSAPTGTASAPAPAADADAIRRVLAEVERARIELIRFLWVDHGSITRGKAVAAGSLKSRMASGIGLAKTRQSAGLSDVGPVLPGFDAVGEVRLVPDPESFVVLPHAPGSAAMLCDLRTLDDEPWDACPRSFLRQALDAAAALGFEVVAAFEPEFTLCSAKPSPDRLDLFDESLCFDNEGFDAAADFSVELSRSLRSQGMDVQTYHPEFGAGQHELTLRHAPAMRAADQFVWQRAFTRGLARRRGLWATFAPVPAPGMRGNGNHVHLSLWRRPESGGPAVNAFAADGFGPASDLGLSATARHFVAGLLAHLPGLCALSCASVNSYERLRPGMWSGAHLGYGYDNREAAVRIPSPLSDDQAGTTNIEVKACDATANPYLVLGALIHAGLDGIRRRLDPGQPLNGDPNHGGGDVPLLPGSLPEAVDALEADEFLTGVLGPVRSMVYPAIKRADAHDAERLGAELSHHLHTLHY